MPGLTRRDLIGGLAIGGIAMSASGPAGGDTMQPPFGPAPPPLAGPELPSFRYALGAAPTKQFNGGTAKEATVAQFPVSEKLAGVYMTLEAGAVRELHWHANAAEWAYMIEGRARVTTIDPENQTEVVDFGPGDTWYFPRGHGHSIQGLDGGCIFILVFDNGYFSEFGTFSITDWLGHTPHEVLAKNFGMPISAFAKFPDHEVYIAKGPVPPPLPEDPTPGSLNAPPLTHRYRLLAQAPEPFPGGTMRVASEMEFPISSTITGALLIIHPGGMRELHWHPNAAEWQYYLKGTGRMTVFGSGGRARTDDFGVGDVGYVPQGYGHYIENTGSDDLELLVVLNNGTYQSISITAWMAGTPDLLLATNFGVPESVFERMPGDAVIMPEQD